MLKIYKNSEKNLLTKNLRKRAENISPEIMTAVAEIIENVRINGDKALREYTKKFDGICPDNLFMTRNELEKIASETSSELKKAVDASAENIRKFHEGQLQQSRVFTSDKGFMGQRVIPLSRVALYVPGGTAAYPSTVLMNAIPAKTAGVKDLVMLTPPKSGGMLPAIAYASLISGVDTVITVGGAQAVAALAYGTESIKRADKIVGPGNIYVAMAKKLVYGTVDIDMIAGPSEILVIADETANPKYIAADLLSQAEHDPMAASILIVTDESLIEKINAEIDIQLPKLSRSAIAEKSIKAYGSAICVKNLDEAAEISDEIAPEHLELAVKDPISALKLINNAGSVFLGQYSPEPLGDYYAGPNHVLPTNGTARFASPLSCDSFIKKSSFIYYTREELLDSADDIIRFAQAEGLDAHANSIAVRKGE